MMTMSHLAGVSGISLIAVAVAIALPASAQQTYSPQTRQQLTDYNNNNIKQNTNKATSSQILQNMNNQFIPSFGALTDTNTWIKRQTFNVPVGVDSGGTGGTNGGDARTGIGAAASGANSDITSVGSAIFYAKNFGSCTWDTTHDVGPCLLAARDAAIAAGAGTIVVPASPAGSYFGLATEVVNGSTGVKFLCAGVGSVNDPILGGSQLIAPCRIKWIGNYVPGQPMYYNGPGPTGATIYATGSVGITWDCGSIADYGAEYQQIGSGKISSIGVNCKVADNWVTTNTNTYGPGTHEAQYDLFARTDDPALTGAGNLIDGQGTAWDVSGDQFGTVQACFLNGPGNVFGFTDSITVDVLQAPTCGANGAGIPNVFANSAYSFPTTSSATPVYNITHLPYTITVRSAYSNILVAGYQTGSTWTPNAGNTGTAALNPITLTTSFLTNILGHTLTFPDTSSLEPGLSVSCGNALKGIMPGNLIVAIPSSTTATLRNPAIGVLASSSNCTFSYGVSVSATFGTYTITAASPSTWNITAPAGGHSQSGLSLTNGVLMGLDIAVPIAGTPVTGDSFTLAVPKAPYQITVQNINSPNNVADPNAEPGATGCRQQASENVCTSFDVPAVIPQQQVQILNANYTLASQTAAQPFLNASPQGSVLVGVGTYHFKTRLHVDGMSSSSGSFGFALGGTATFTQNWRSMAVKSASASNTAQTPAVTYNVANALTLIAANTGPDGWYDIDGLVRVTAPGTLIPEISLGVASAATVHQNAFFSIDQISPSATFVTVGNWQ